MSSLLLNLLLVALISAPRNVHAHETYFHTVRGQAGERDKPVPAMGGVRNFEDTACPSGSADDKLNQPNRKRNDPQWWGVWINGIIALFTLGTLVLVNRQVQAIRNVERAFLIPLWQDELWSHPEWVNKSEMRHCFLWRFKNEGKTPAFIREVYGHIAIYRTKESIPTKPKYPRTEIKVYEGDPMPTGFVMERDFWVGIENEVSDFHDTNSLYRTQGQVLFAYGIVRYEDMFGGKHETRFGVIYHADPESTITGKWQIGGPTAYNSYT